MSAREPRPWIVVDEIGNAFPWLTQLNGWSELRTRIGEELQRVADAAAAREREPMECGHPRACGDQNTFTQPGVEGHLTISLCSACAREAHAVEEATRQAVVNSWPEALGEVHQNLLAEAEARVRRECVEIALAWAKNPLNDKSPATTVLKDFAFAIERGTEKP